MGILNLTPDSFFEDSRISDTQHLLRQAAKMLDEGAQFIDIGGYSSRPNAKDITEEEEISRVIPAIESLVEKFPEVLISIDTFRSRVADLAIEAGAAMVNDISAGNLDNNMMEVIAKHQVPYIMMHMQGTPQTMQSKTTYNDLLEDILYYFSEKIRHARALKINDLIVDPGFGFSKNNEQNYELLSKLHLLENLKLPILAGVSRKSMIYKNLESSAKDALNGTTVLNTIALNNGASILRVHDVKEAAECVKLYSLLNK